MMDSWLGLLLWPEARWLDLRVQTTLNSLVHAVLSTYGWHVPCETAVRDLLGSSLCCTVFKSSGSRANAQGLQASSISCNPVKQDIQIWYQRTLSPGGDLRATDVQLLPVSFIRIVIVARCHAAGSNAAKQAAP